jgi:hypothetical protein
MRLRREDVQKRTRQVEGSKAKKRIGFIGAAVLTGGLMASAACAHGSVVKSSNDSETWLCPSFVTESKEAVDVRIVIKKALIEEGNFLRNVTGTPRDNDVLVKVVMIVDKEGEVTLQKAIARCIGARCPNKDVDLAKEISLVIDGLAVQEPKPWTKPAKECKWTERFNVPVR